MRISTSVASSHDTAPGLGLFLRFLCDALCLSLSSSSSSLLLLPEEMVQGVLYFAIAGLQGRLRRFLVKPKADEDLNVSRILP
mmetsp:Transcript_30953/g.99346  ORF Transcript_30953/g.99346 Transcript_30953/m.99346 type:complete len:83 (-) Transcript_30953:8-256(-)